MVNLMIGFIAIELVSANGSPTVSPTTRSRATELYRSFRKTSQACAFARSFSSATRAEAAGLSAKVANP